MGLTSADINLLLNWAAIFAIPVVPVALWSLSKGGVGLKWSITLAAGLISFASVLRLVPCFFPSLRAAGGGSIYVLHAAQILNGLAGPITMSAPALLSAVWFAPEERALATAIGALANNLGAALGFLLAFVVKGPEDVPLLLQICAGLSCACALCVFVYVSSVSFCFALLCCLHPHFK